MNYKNIAIVLKTKIRRYFSDKFSYSRPGSYPFLTGDGFRQAATFIFDTHYSFDPKLVGYGDIIFVRGDYLASFFLTMHADIANPYVLVSHNDDFIVTEEYKDKIDNKILHWFAMSLQFVHEKATPLPAGIESLFYYRSRCSMAVFSDIANNRNVEKNKRIMFSFDCGGYSTMVKKYGNGEEVVKDPYVEKDYPNKERKAAYEAASVHPLTDKKFFLERVDYLKSLSGYPFIIGPTGQAIEACRNWEAMYMRVIPIVMKNAMTAQFEKMGFPMLLVESWDDLAKFDTDYLMDFYEKNKYKFDTPKLKLDYWYDSFHKFRSAKK